MFKRLRSKINKLLYRYHRKKYLKYLSKSIGAKRYISKYCEEDTKAMCKLWESFAVGTSSIDVNSMYPSVMKIGKFNKD